MSEDLSQMIQNFIGSEEGQEKLKSMAEMLNSGDGGLDLSQIGNLFGGSNENGNSDDNSGGNSDDNSNKESSQPDMGGLDMNTLLKVQSMMGQFKKEDKNTRLILALKPHLKPERQAKADDAINIMRLISILPMLKESGLLGKDGGLLGNLLK